MPTLKQVENSARVVGKEVLNLWLSTSQKNRIFWEMQEIIDAAKKTSLLKRWITDTNNKAIEDIKNIIAKARFLACLRSFGVFLRGKHKNLKNAITILSQVAQDPIIADISDDVFKEVTKEIWFFCDLISLAANEKQWNRLSENDKTFFYKLLNDIKDTDGVIRKKDEEDKGTLSSLKDRRLVILEEDIKHQQALLLKRLKNDKNRSMDDEVNSVARESFLEKLSICLNSIVSTALDDLEHEQGKVVMTAQQQWEIFKRQEQIKNKAIDALKKIEVELDPDDMESFVEPKKKSARFSELPNDSLGKNPPVKIKKSCLEEEILKLNSESKLYSVEIMKKILNQIEKDGFNHIVRKRLHERVRTIIYNQILSPDDNLVSEEEFSSFINQEIQKFINEEAKKDFENKKEELLDFCSSLEKDQDWWLEIQLKIVDYFYNPLPEVKSGGISYVKIQQNKEENKIRKRVKEMFEADSNWKGFIFNLSNSDTFESFIQTISEPIKNEIHLRRALRTDVVCEKDKHPSAESIKQELVNERKSSFDSDDETLIEGFNNNNPISRSSSFPTVNNDGDESFEAVLYQETPEMPENQIIQDDEDDEIYSDDDNETVLDGFNNRPISRKQSFYEPVNSMNLDTVCSSAKSISIVEEIFELKDVKIISEKLNQLLEHETTHFGTLPDAEERNQERIKNWNEVSQNKDFLEKLAEMLDGEHSLTKEEMKPFLALKGNWFERNKSFESFVSKLKEVRKSKSATFIEKQQSCADTVIDYRRRWTYLTWFDTTARKTLNKAEEHTKGFFSGCVSFFGRSCIKDNATDRFERLAQNNAVINEKGGDFSKKTLYTN